MPARSDPVPREKVEQLAAHFGDLLQLRNEQAVTMATMIRGCVQAIRLGDNPDASPKVRRAEGFTARNQARKEVCEDKTRALLYLEWLATSLEDQSTKGDKPCTAE